MCVLVDRYTCRPQEKSVFATLLEWPRDGLVKLSEPVVTLQSSQVRHTQPSHTALFVSSRLNRWLLSLQIKVELLGFGRVQWETVKPKGLWVLLPTLSYSQMPCQWAWTLRITNAT